MGLTKEKRNIEHAGGKVWFENSYPYEQDKQNLIRLIIAIPGQKKT